MLIIMTNTCPQAEKIILGTIYDASMHYPKVLTQILRMFFHDYFVRVHVYDLSVFFFHYIIEIGYIDNRLKLFLGM
jgi:hypothetical protein